LAGFFYGDSIAADSLSDFVGKLFVPIVLA